MKIQFTQYMFPNGDIHEVFIDRPDDIALKAERIKDDGFVLEIENQCEMIWMSASKHYAEIFFDRLVPNGPDVVVAVDSLINEVYEYVEGAANIAQEKSVNYL